jgi:hypothetical protein
VNPKHIGDIYDIVKQSLLRCLAGLGKWYAHPMFTAPFTEAQAREFGRLLGVPLLSAEVLTQGADRGAYLSVARACSGHLFLDPDTGVRLKLTRGKKAPAYLFGGELVDIATRHPDLLTLVFDQALARGGEAAALGSKLEWLATQGLHGFAYQSHASFVLVGSDTLLVRKAQQALRCEGHLPESRFVERGGRTTSG